MHVPTSAARWVAALAIVTGSSALAIACGGGGSSPSSGPTDDAAIEGGNPDAPVIPLEASLADTSVVVDSGAAVVDSGTVVPEAAVDSGFVVGAHTLPQVVNNGGPTFAHPTLYTITYAGDSERAWAEQLGSYLVTSPWLQAVGPEYGIGTGTHVPVELAESAPTTIDDSQVQAFIAARILEGVIPAPSGGATIPVEPGTPFDQVDAGVPFAWGNLDAGEIGNGGTTARLLPAIYMLYIPLSTTLTVEGVALCDYSGGGYHYLSYGSFGGVTFAYAVVGLCPQMDMSTLEQSVSHEFIEAATDPAYTSNGWAITDQNSVWSYFGGEVGDLCSFVEPQWAEGAYTNLQRVYSNKAAASGGDPCQPATGAYYATDVEPQTWVAVPSGQSTVFEVAGWSTAPVSPWSILAQPYLSSPSGLAPATSLPTMMMQNGQTTTLQVTMPTGLSSGDFILMGLGSYISQTNYDYSLVGMYVP
jgi:hypothetical protein